MPQNSIGRGIEGQLKKTTKIAQEYVLYWLGKVFWRLGLNKARFGTLCAVARLSHSWVSSRDAIRLRKISLKSFLASRL